MSTEAMKLALEALEESLGYVEEEAENAQRLYGQYPTRQARIQGLKDDVRKHMKAITALREALAEQPAQRAWVGLTDEEIDDLSREMVKGNKSVNWLSYSIEAKLRERNT
jgi:hypothetical protein